MQVGEPIAARRQMGVDSRTGSNSDLRGRIPDAKVREIVDRSDMLAIVGEVVDLSRAGQQFKGLCPFHAERTPSFHVNPALKLYHCYGCGAGGDLIRFVQETRGLTFPEVLELLAERAQVTIERAYASPEQASRQAAEKAERGRLLELARVCQQFFRSRYEGSAAAAYAANRGLSQETVVQFGLGASGTGWTELTDHCKRLGWREDDLCKLGVAVRRDGDNGRGAGGAYDRFRNRLMFPIFTSAGDLVGFGGRDLSGEQNVAKYMNTPESTVDGEAEGSPFHYFYKKGAVVFGLWQARQAMRKAGYAILCEGNLDVMQLAQAGMQHAVCAMGTALTEQHLHELQRFVPRLVLILDGDNAGRRAAHKAIPLCVAAGLEGGVVWLPQGEDPDSFLRKHGPEALQLLIDRAPPMLNAWLDGLVKEWDGSLQGRTRILTQVGPLLAQLGQRDPMTRDQAYDYVVAKLDGGRLEDARSRMGGYLDRAMVLGQPLVQSVAATAGRPQQANPTRGEAPLPQLESDLAELLVWYPALLRDAETAGRV
jgi:DNA primase